MTKYISYFLFIFCFNMFSQNNLIEQIEKKETLIENIIQLELNFNSLNKTINNQEVFELEIQPIADCMTGLEGRTMFEPTVIDVKNNKIITIDYKLVKRKCCKYRVKITKDNQITYSDWYFHALVTHLTQNYDKIIYF